MPPEELRQQRAALVRGGLAELEAHESVSAHLLDAGAGRAFQLLGEAREEGADRAGVPLDSAVLQVQARRVGIGGDPQAQDGGFVGVRSLWLEHQQHVARRQALGVLDARPGEKAGELLDELGDVPRLQVQESSSSTL